MNKLIVSLILLGLWNIAFAISNNPFKALKTTKSYPLYTELLQINYAKAVDIAAILRDKNNTLLSERGRVNIDTRTNTLWIQDSRNKILEIRELIQKIDVPIKQVLIEARIVNVTRAAIEDLGIKFGVSSPESDTLSTNSMVNKLNIDFGSMMVNPASIGIALAKLGDGIILDLELSALESESKAEIIASPA